jgi:hypothetical protein
MPWVLIPGALRRLRRAKRLDREATAKLLGLHPWTIHRHETHALAPHALRAYLVKIYMRGYQCDAESFAVWKDHGDAGADRPQLVRDPAAPKIQMLTERAKHELALGIRGKKTVRFGGEEIPVVGNAIINECMTAFALYQDKRFAVEGLISDTRYLPEAAAHKLDAPLGAGGTFRIDREIVRGLPVYVSVFTRTAEHTRHLIDCNNSEKTTTVIVRICIKPPEGDWKGFFIFEKKPKPRPWIFLVEDIVNSTGAPT